MENVLKVAKGYDGELELLEDKVRIRRRGFFSTGESNEILIKRISSIGFKEASLLSYGYIEFIFSGGQEMKFLKGILRDKLLKDVSPRTLD